MDGSVWVILPTYDEAENLEAVVGGIRAAVPEAQILVVDDNSPDGTGDLADAMARDDAALDVLHRPGKSGLGRAYTAGFAHALAARRGLRGGDGRRPLPRPRRPPAPDRARASTAPTSCSARATRTAAGSRTGAWTGA